MIIITYGISSVICTHLSGWSPFKHSSQASFTSKVLKRPSPCCNKYVYKVSKVYGLFNICYTYIWEFHIKHFTIKVHAKNKFVSNFSNCCKFSFRRHRGTFFLKHVPPPCFLPGYFFFKKIKGNVFKINIGI